MTGIYRLIVMYNNTGIYDSNRAILGWMLQNLEKVGKCSIYTVAEETYCSTATISRLIKKMGYSNYHYFQKDITDDFIQYEYHNRIIPLEKIQPDEEASDLLISLLKKLIEELEKNLDKCALNQLVDDLYTYDKIVLYLYEEVTAKFWLQYDLFMKGKLCETYSSSADIERHSKDVDSGNLVIIFSCNYIKHSDTKSIVENLKKNGAKVCFVTDSQYYASKIDADIKFVLPGIGGEIDMLMLEIFMYLLTIQFRQKYGDKTNV